MTTKTEKKAADRAPTLRQWAEKHSSQAQWAIDRLTDAERDEFAKALQADHQCQKLMPVALRLQSFRERVEKIIAATAAEVGSTP